MLCLRPEPRWSGWQMAKARHRKRKRCSPQGQRETGRGCAPWQERALPSVGSLQPLRACGGCQADLKEGHLLLKMSLSVDIL